MKTLVIGGTGFLGYYVALELAPLRDEVVLFGRGKLLLGQNLPAQVRIQTGDMASLDASGLADLVRDFDEIVFAAGKDDRTLVKVSPLEYFMHENVTMLERVFRAMFHAKESSRVKAFVLFNSFFATAARRHPEWKLAETHPYIHSRMMQQKLIDTFRPKLPEVGFSILEIPFVMGTIPGEAGLFTPLALWLRRLPFVVIFPGTISLVTAQDVAKATRHALESPQGLGALPLSSWDVSWKEWIDLFLEEMDVTRPVFVLPKGFFNQTFSAMSVLLKLRGYQSGLDQKLLAELLCKDLAVGLSPDWPGEEASPEEKKRRVKASIREIVKSAEHVR